MNSSAPRIVFDCNIFVQSLIRPGGPAGACIQSILQRQAQLSVSPYVFQELRAAPTKPTPNRMGVTSAKVERLIANLLLVANIVADVPNVFEHPIDPDDSHYVNLALATQSKLIVSRDRHLLGLSAGDKPWAADFRRRFPDLQIVPPQDLLAMLRAE